MSPVRLAIAVLIVAGCCVLAVACGGGNKASPWLYCTTNPCQPLGLFPVPTPAALTHDPLLAATCDYSAAGAADGVLLWHTDWDPRTEKGRCVSKEEADKLTGSQAKQRVGGIARIEEERRASRRGQGEPFFRWNHNWAIKRAMEGLEPYARANPMSP